MCAYSKEEEGVKQVALDDKTIQKLAGQLGLSGSVGKRQAQQHIKAYEQKSDAELVDELLKMQQKLNAANIPYEKQIAAVESLMPLMDEKQKARLRKIIGLLKK